MMWRPLARETTLRYEGRASIMMKKMQVACEGTKWPEQQAKPGVAAQCCHPYAHCLCWHRFRCTM